MSIPNTNIRLSKIKNQERKCIQAKESIYKTYDELPLFLNAATVAEVLGVSPSSSYELMHEPGFSSIRTGNRIVVPKDSFIQWVEQSVKGGKRWHITQSQMKSVSKGIGDVAPTSKIGASAEAPVVVF